MKYIVLDLEFNQAYDFGDGKDNFPDEKCPFEIIQIGAVKLNEKFEYEASLNLLIKPDIYKRIHPYVEKITGLNSSILENQQTFKAAYEKLIEFADKKRVIYCVWGSNDIKELYKNIMYYDLADDVITFNFIDVQNIASKYINNAPGMCIGLKNAVMALGLEAAKPFHNALYDAEYTAKVLQRLKYEPINIKQFSHDNIVKIAKTPHTIDFSAMYKYVEKELGRRITKKEKRIYRNIYFYGKEKKFDKK